jgi:hypothetical protein
MSNAISYHGTNITEDKLVSDATLARFRANGTAWAYELAEAVVLQCRYFGLTNGMQLPMGIAAAWYNEILTWSESVAADVRSWRERCPRPGTKVQTPEAVEALLKQAHKLLVF